MQKGFNLNKYSYEYIKECFEKRGYTLSEEYRDDIKVTDKLKYICNQHQDKGTQYITFSKLHSCGQGCYYCGRNVTEQAHMIALNKNDCDKKICENKGFIYKETIRENGKIKIKYICPNHLDVGIQIMTKDNMVKRKTMCPYCIGRNIPKDYILNKISTINPNVELLEDFNNLTDRIECRCKKHGIISHKSIQEILKGRGCIECGREKLSEKGFLTISEYQNKVNNKTNNIEVLEYLGINSNAHFKCKQCGYDWWSSAGSMANNGKQCPNCERYYSGEKFVSDFLEKHNIQFIPQYRFEDCKDKRSLPFDFYLPFYRTCIEYDGIQHFRQRNGWTDLELIQKHDEIKNKYCNDNNIQLIRIPYYEDTESFLLEKLKILNIINA